MAKLRHIAIITRDPERLAKFYTEVFEMKVLHRPPSGSVFLTDGVMNVALLRNKAEGKPNGLNHIGFHIENPDEINARLAEWGIEEPARRPDDRPYAEARTTDPDGNNIDLSVHGFERVELVGDQGKKETLETVEG